MYVVEAYDLYLCGLWRPFFYSKALTAVTLPKPPSPPSVTVTSATDPWLEGEKKVPWGGPSLEWFEEGPKVVTGSITCTDRDLI